MPNLNRPTILVVEDDLDIQLNVKILLEQNHFSVVLTNNGKEALDFLDQGKRADFILLDLMMPVMTGYEFLEALQSRKRPPIALFSAASDVAQTAKEWNIPFLKKPVHPRDLLNIITKSLPNNA